MEHAYHVPCIPFFETFYKNFDLRWLYSFVFFVSWSLVECLFFVIIIHQLLNSIYMCGYECDEY